MAKCDYCNSLILFGGTKRGKRQFCSEDCLSTAKLMKEADRLPQHVVDGAIRETHQGDCPECEGAGPVDIHNSHTVWSAFVLTSWKNTPNLCCKSCGRSHQLNSLVSSFFMGWWGFPWGIIYTPIQIARNLTGILGGPDPDTPSEQFETIMRLDLAGRSLAGEPMPEFNQRPARSRSDAAQPVDDRIPGECDHCGKQFRAKTSLAGRAVKCRGCGSKVIVPDVEDYDSSDDEWSDGDGGNWYSISEAGAGNASRRGSGGASKKRHQPRKKSSVLRKVGLVALCFFAANIVLAVIGGVVVMLTQGNPAPAPAPVGQRNPGPANFPDRPAFRPPALRPPDFGSPGPPNQKPPKFEGRPEPFSLPGSVSAAESPLPDPGTTASNSSQPVAEMATPEANSVAANPFQPVDEMPAMDPLPNVDRSGTVWFVLSNLREGERKSMSIFDKPFLLDYQLASGSPSSADGYVLHLAATRGGTFKQHATVKFPLQENGTIEFKLPPQLASADKFTAAIALPASQRRLNDVSEEISPGDAPTAAVAPPSVVELAGAGAQGKALAIASPEFGKDDGPFPNLKLKFVLQQEIQSGSYYLLVATPASGTPIEFDLSHTLRRASVGVETEYNGRLLGPSASLKPPFKIHVVRRKSRFSSRVQKEPPVIVSNTVNVAE